MKINLSSLLLSSILCTSAVMGSNIKLSDAYNGLIPEDTKQDPIKLKKYQEDISTLFIDKENKLMSMQDQLVRFFGPIGLKGNKVERIRANAVCDFNEQKISKVGFIKSLFDAHKG
ncbi:MAG: hypothetical protein IBJ00_07900, partial [Alphaproteobacteria bacterium]|nr:hypothetical protein [Alphaproteobacteria bacterium]